MDIYFDKIFLDSLPERVYSTIDQKLQRICQCDFLQFRFSVSCRKIKAVKDIFKFRFSDGDRIVFKYIHNGIRLVQYTTHDKQIKVALNYNKIRDTLTDKLIKWSDNAIRFLLLKDLPKVFDENVDTVKEHNICHDYEYQYIVAETSQNEEKDILDTPYEEDEIDEEIEASILQLLKQDILNDNFNKDIIDKFLNNNDIEKAMYYEEIINIADRKIFYEDHRSSLSSIMISKNEHGKITLDNIRASIDLFYDKTELCIYPLFLVWVVGTGYKNMLYIQTENRKDVVSSKNNIITLLLSRVGAVEKWGEIIISFLAIKKENYVSAARDCDLFIEPESHFVVSPSKNSVERKSNNSYLSVFSYYGNKNVSPNDANLFAYAKRYEQDDEKVLAHNLDFIFNK